jgi:hypothetical protein
MLPVEVTICIERDIRVVCRCVLMCFVHRCAANCVKFVVTEARHDLHFCHCTVVCTNPISRELISTGSAYDCLGDSQLSYMSESVISRQKKINFSITLFNCNTRANHMFWQSKSPEFVSRKVSMKDK